MSSSFGNGESLNFLSQDAAAWGTGNGWAAGGAVRVLATILKAPCASPELQLKAQNIIIGYIQEMLNAILSAKRDGDLLRNYIDDYDSKHGYGELAGMTMISSAVFRMAVLAPQIFSRDSEYVKFAMNTLTILGQKDANGTFCLLIFIIVILTRTCPGTAYVSSEGLVRPTVNPLNWQDTKPYNDVSYHPFQSNLKLTVSRGPLRLKAL